MTNAFAESAAAHRTRAVQMLAELDNGRDATKFGSGQAVEGLATIHALLGILDAITAQTAHVCRCPARFTYHAQNCDAYPAGSAGFAKSVPVGKQAPVGGTAGWVYPS